MLIDMAIESVPIVMQKFATQKKQKIYPIHVYIFVRTNTDVTNGMKW
jgi:hypothetical protein